MSDRVIWPEHRRCELRPEPVNPVRLSLERTVWRLEPALEGKLGQLRNKLLGNLGYFMKDETFEAVILR